MPLAVTALLLAVALVALVVTRQADAEGQTADIRTQGGELDEVLHDDAARLIRRADGLVLELDMPTPQPGSYEYPDAELTPPWSDPHPPVTPGASDAPEVFTTWLATFNYPERCTDGRCDFDDLGADTAAGGGNYQVDARIASDGRLVMVGSVRVGQETADGGAQLENPLGAEVHIAVAPHGRALSGANGWRQLNGPVGTPEYWWSATFMP